MASLKCEACGSNVMRLYEAKMHGFIVKLCASCKRDVKSNHKKAK